MLFPSSSSLRVSNSGTKVTACMMTTLFMLLYPLEAVSVFSAMFPPVMSSPSLATEDPAPQCDVLLLDHFIALRLFTPSQWWEWISVCYPAPHVRWEQQSPVPHRWTGALVYPPLVVCSGAHIPNANCRMNFILCLDLDLQSYCTPNALAYSKYAAGLVYQCFIWASVGETALNFRLHLCVLHKQIKNYLKRSICTNDEGSTAPSNGSASRCNTFKNILTCFEGHNK